MSTPINSEKIAIQLMSSIPLANRDQDSAKTSADAQQRPEMFNTVGKVGAMAIELTETIEHGSSKIQLFVQNIFAELQSCTTAMKAIVTDVFSSFERLETLPSSIDPMASVQRAWNSATASPSATPAKNPSSTTTAKAQTPESVSTGLKTSLLKKISFVENTAQKTVGIAIKIFEEIAVRITSIKKFIITSLSGFRELEKALKPTPIVSAELNPIFDAIRRIFSNLGKPEKSATI